MSDWFASSVSQEGKVHSVVESAKLDWYHKHLNQTMRGTVSDYIFLYYGQKTASSSTKI